jgi:hypothetical protein
MITLMESHPRQDTAHVLSRFGRMAKATRRKYREFVAKGITVGKRPDPVSGGLAGQWVKVKALRKAKFYMKGDERILG